MMEIPEDIWPAINDILDRVHDARYGHCPKEDVEDEIARVILAERRRGEAAVVAKVARLQAECNLLRSSLSMSHKALVDLADELETPMTSAGEFCASQRRGT